MLVEAEAIPYDAARLLGERLLILAPHPDDEVIGCGGLIAQHLLEHRAVRVIVATDGAEADPSAMGDPEAYRARREDESRRALALLGVTDVHFLRFPDRALGDAVAESIREHLVEFRPDLVCVPSPIEIHPDHLALSLAFCTLVQRDDSLFADLAITRVAFYEVSQPLRPNTLVDITDVAEQKYAAIAVHESQTAIRDYVSYARGLNAYRALTLPPDRKFAEAYWVTQLSELRTMAFGALRRAVGEPATIEITRTTLPITVVVRTKDRPALLREAVDSVLWNDHPAQIVVVNDGGAVPAIDRAKIINHETPRGRSEAMNSGVRAAATKYIAFLDDDDLFYPEHLGTLATAAQSAAASAAWYTDAVSSFLQIGATGGYQSRSRMRLFGSDYDRQQLLVDNYIPLPTLLVERDTFLDLGGFDAEFDLFEDWDFLIRLSQRGDFTRVPRVTCEVRHFEGGTSILLASPEGSTRFRDAKLQVWRKHASLITPNTFADAFERQKRRATELQSAAVDEKGRRASAENDIARLEREKNQLIGELQKVHYSINEHAIYIKELEGRIAMLRGDAERAVRESAAARQSASESEATCRIAYAEIERLQGLLNMIYKSRTWKMHALMERMKGRG